MIDTAHIYSRNLGLITCGLDILRVNRPASCSGGFSSCGREVACLDAAGWLQLGSSRSCLGAVARLPALASLLPGVQIFIVPPPVCHRIGPTGDTC